MLTELMVDAPYAKAGLNAIPKKHTAKMLLNNLRTRFIWLPPVPG